MDSETAKYIVNYFLHLMSDKEKLVWKHQVSIIKLDNNKEPRKIKLYKEKGWISDDKEVIDLLNDGYDTFELETAQKILEKHPDKIFLNRCPKCNRLARTPYAKQCRFCNFNWHKE